VVRGPAALPPPVCVPPPLHATSTTTPAITAAILFTRPPASTRPLDPPNPYPRGRAR
jgi:hypothetical protein